MKREVRFGIFRASTTGGRVWIATTLDKRSVHGLRTEHLDIGDAQAFSPPCDLAAQGSLVTFDDSLVTCKSCLKKMAPR